MSVQYTNNATTTLSSAINSTDTIITVATGTGGLFPVLGTGSPNWFYITIIQSTGFEIAKATATSGDSFTIERAQDGTTAKSFAAGSQVSLYVTRALLQDLAAELSGIPNAGIPVSTGTAWNPVSKTAPTGDIVGTTDSQSISHKIIQGLAEVATSVSIATGAINIDCSSANVFNVSLTESISTITFSNIPTTTYALTYNNIGSGSAYTITWPASVKWTNSGTAPTLTSTSGKVDTFVLFTWDSGTTWYGFIAGTNA